MKPFKKEEIAIVRITFTLDTSANIVHPGSADDDPDVQEWYYRTIREEKKKIADPSQLRHSKWRIVSRIPEIFIIDGYHYQNIILVLAEDVKHWIFYDNHTNKRVTGKSRIPLVYCPCCFYDHYDRVIKTIKQCVEMKERS